MLPGDWNEVFLLQPITFFMPGFYQKIFTTLFLSFSLYTFLNAQPSPAQKDDDLPKDYLSKDFHAGRRDALRSLMPANSVVVIFAYPTRTFSNDVEYLYHQNPDMYYFSGYKEPHSVLLIFKDQQTDSTGNNYNELLK